jgi:hypothetical protein
MQKSFELQENVQVQYGPPCWIGSKGSVIGINGDTITVQLKNTDDGGEALFDVVFPHTCLKAAQKV